MEYKYEKTPVEWVKELPELCTECNQAVTDKSFTSKKGEHWNKAICNDCGITWMKSKPKGQTQASGGVNNREILDKLMALREMLLVMDKKLDDLADI